MNHMSKHRSPPIEVSAISNGNNGYIITDNSLSNNIYFGIEFETLEQAEDIIEINCKEKIWKYVKLS